MSGGSSPEPNVPDHELLRIIGHGAYGEVWLARNALGAYRAIKVVYRKDFEQSRPFEREFRGIEKFEPISRSHEGLVHILQVGRREDYFYYVMELADDASAECGIWNAESESNRIEKASALTANSALPTPHSYAPRTLREDLRRHGRLPADRCVEIGLGLASALAHLHKHGLVHRDVKPSNTILVGGKPKLADIGLVTDAGDSQSIVGTEGYLPPEGPGAPQADVFSLGKVLYEISTGQDRRQFPDLPPGLNEWPDRELVLELNEIVLKACAQDSRCRYGSAQEMLADVRLLQRGSSVRRKRAVQEWLSVAWKVVLAISLIALAGTVLVSLRSSGDGYLHSKNPEVNNLFKQANTILQDKTDDRIHDALAGFNEAIRLDPSFVPAYFGIFRAYMIQGAADSDAPTDLRQHLWEAGTNLMHRFPDYAEAHAAQSMLDWVNWQFPKARAEARAAIHMRAACVDGQATTRNYYGWFLLESGKPEEALEQYKLAYALTPDRSIIQLHMGFPFFDLRNFEEALKHYRESLLQQRNQSGAHYQIARVYEEQTNFMAAIDEFIEVDKVDGRANEESKTFYDALRKAVQQDPVNGYWRKRLQLEPKANPYHLATLYARLHQWDQAYAHLQEACETKSFNSGLMRDLCWNHSDTNFVAIAKGIGMME